MLSLLTIALLFNSSISSAADVLSLPSDQRLDPIDFVDLKTVTEKIYQDHDRGIWHTILTIQGKKEDLILTTQDYIISLFSKDCPWADCGSPHMEVEFEKNTHVYSGNVHGMQLFDTRYDRPMPNKFSGDIERISSIKIDAKQKGKHNTYHHHDVFSITKADTPFRSTYAGYYGLKAAKNFGTEKDFSIPLLLKYENKITQIVTALYTCEETIKDGEWYLKYGGWNKQEAAIDDDVQKIDVQEQSWKMLVEKAQFDIQNIWQKHTDANLDDYRYALFEPQFNHIHIPQKDFDQLKSMVMDKYNKNSEQVKCSDTQGNCYFPSMSCDNVRAIDGLMQETWMHISVTDSYLAKDKPKKFSLRFALEHDLYDIPIHASWRTQSEWGCYFPIAALSDHTENKQFRHIIDDNVWYLGQTVMKMYFTILDSRPQYRKSQQYSNTSVQKQAHAHEIYHQTKNVIGIAACKKHTMMLAASTTNPHGTTQAGASSGSGGIVAVVIILIIFIMGAAVFVVVRSRNKQAKAANVIASGTFQ